MAKNVKVVEESPTGLNRKFKIPNGDVISRQEFINKIKGGYPDYHIRQKGSLKYPASNPDKSKGNNLG